MIENLSASLATQLIAESLDAVLIVDECCRIRYANSALEKLSGYLAGELLGESLNGLLPAAIAAEHDQYVRRYLDSLRPSTVLGRVRELEMRHRTGELIPIELKAVDLGMYAKSHFFGAFFSDLRERKASEARNATLLAQLEQQSLTDPLTGLPNRRAFELEATRVMANARREGWPVAIGIADIDWFKRINDTYGHPVGDVVLRTVAHLLQTQMRGGDLCGRLGGEEFGLLLPHADERQAMVIAERIRVALAALPIGASRTTTLEVTISIGLVRFDMNQALDVSLAKADAALYQAKLAGRNRVRQG